MTDRDTLKAILAEKFPKMWMKDSEEFNSTPGGIWTGENSYHPDGVEMFNYWDESFVLYDMGTHVDLVAVLDEHGWFAEFHDPGTVMIFPS